MARIIVSIVFLVILVVIIVLNIGHTASFNFFGWQLEKFPVTAIAVLSFVLGVIYSFVFYLFSYFTVRRRQRLARKSEQLKNREESLAARERTFGDLLQARSQTMEKKPDGSARGKS